MLQMFKSKASLDLEITRRSIEACEQIIEEMGADIHDDLVQRLSVFRLYLDRLERSKSDPHEVNALIVSMNADFQEVVNSVRRVSRRLMPVKMEDDTFQERIVMLCKELEKPGKGSILFESSGNERKIQELAEIYLYRIVQELVHNAFKHSAAWHVHVKATWDETYLTLEVEDDGTSFTKISEFVTSLKKKYNTLRMRSEAIGAKIKYLRGSQGLLVQVRYKHAPKIQESAS